jgi:hypothetical protein
VKSVEMEIIIIFIAALTKLPSAKKISGSNLTLFFYIYETKMWTL